ncbi:DUF4843 domain-containing protein [Sanguibacteroides justesenii]|uniref:Uncharacterized protein n=1 Tax=Sanguibacteroides justesenii TaxID=1547597 RepID=A0A0C3M8V3_9PORP|nr:DUF4843 domain-containing protein [Sanguibacteroides justesenii]KIO42838.1 hypothetical protein BA92_13290 [Sanguibacteroides justesenii]PXZ44155.1 DUF4843 domain-containing protein [Sanguibacteroides justesenii]
MGRLFSLLIGISLLISCSKEEIPMYGPEHYVQFTDIWTDSLEYSFFFYSWANDLQIPLAVKLVGDPLKEKTKFVIKVVENETTAKPSQYGLPEEIYFKPNQTEDTLYLTLKKVDLTRKVRLVVEIQSGGDLMPGQTIYTRKIIWFSDEVTRPTWWPEGGQVEKIFLGPYTVTKFRKFMEVTKVGDLTDYNYDERRALALEFKNELIRLSEMGDPCYDEDNSLMLSSVPVLGN